MKHINLTNWHGSLTDWTKLNYIYGGLDDSYAVKGNLRIDKDNYNYVELRESKNLIALNDVAETTISGVTYKAENGVIYMNGTNTSSGAVGIIFKFNEFNGTYTMLLDGYKNTFQNGVQIRLNGTYVDTIAINKDTKTISNKNFDEIRLIVAGGMTINATIKPMIVSGSTVPSAYEPYFEGKKYVITENLKYVNVSEEILNNIDSLTFRSTTGGYEIGKDGGWLLETITGTATSPFTITNSNDVYNNSDNYVMSNSWVSLPNTYDTKEKYIDYFTNNVIEAVVIKSTPTIEVVE